MVGSIGRIGRDWTGAVPCISGVSDLIPLTADGQLGWRQGASCCDIDHGDGCELSNASRIAHVGAGVSSPCHAQRIHWRICQLPGDAITGDGLLVMESHIVILFYDMGPELQANLTHAICSLLILSDPDGHNKRSGAGAKQEATEQDKQGRKKVFGSHTTSSG